MTDLLPQHALRHAFDDDFQRYQDGCDYFKPASLIPSTKFRRYRNRRVVTMHAGTAVILGTYDG